MKDRLIKFILREYLLALRHHDNSRADLLFMHLSFLMKYKKWYQFWL